jgi:cytoskeletal protein RodZ
MDCKVFRQEFETLNAGEHPSAQAQAHLNSCPACRSFQSERLSLRQLIGTLGTVGAPPDFDFRLRARLAAAKSTEGYSFHRKRFAPGLKAITVAASFALLITAAIIFRQTQSAPAANPATTQQAATTSENDGRAEQNANNDSEQLADNSQNREASPVTENTNPSRTNEVVSQAGRSAGKPTPAQASRRDAPLKAERSPIISNEFTLRGNPTVVTPVRQPATASTTNEEDAATLLRVSSQPVRILLHDRQGAMRSVSLERVVFGSQSFLERPVQRRAVASDAEGIW